MLSAREPHKAEAGKGPQRLDNSRFAPSNRRRLKSASPADFSGHRGFVGTDGRAASPGARLSLPVDLSQLVQAGP